jgi:1,4-dihydroxy-2-naphthoyl-CoA synthase
MSNNKQQTAVEWYAGRHYDLELLRSFGAISIVEYYEELTKAVQQAKEMEKIEKQNYLKAYFDWHKQMGFVSHKAEDIIEYNFVLSIGNIRRQQ